MNNNFSDRKKEDGVVENKLRLMQDEYQKQQMSQAEIEKLQQKIKEAKMEKQRFAKKSNVKKYVSIAAVIIAAIIILPNTSGSLAYAMEQIPVIGKLIQVVTFRDYKFESDRHMADIEVPEITVDEVAGDNQENEVLNQTVEEINAEIQDITDEIISQFETYLSDEEGYQDVMVKSEILATTDEYFTLKLICFQAAGSGYQWNYYYTIDLKTGERMKLKDVFVEGADYITLISDNIKQQMQEQMDADEQKHYWLHDEIDELNFKAITEDTSFYLNEHDNVVIGFNEGDVAPMYMGAVEFEIPHEVLSGIRK